MDRRRLLQSALACAGAAAVGGGWPGRAQGAEAGTPFSFAWLVVHARQVAAAPYVAPAPVAAAARLGYAVSIATRTRPGHQLWHDRRHPFSVEFFPVDKGSPVPVAIHLVTDGRARRLAYDPDMFIYPRPGLAAELPRDLGYAGFRLHDTRRDHREWLAFKGASYFRSPGPDNQYGLSARGVTVDSGEPGPESFPDFTAFWIEQPAPGADTITIWALLDGPHLTGAYQMRCRHPGDVLMDIRARLFQRRAIDRLGIAPLTSMFWFSETNARHGADWRPEVHDSDGLAMATGAGEHLWRPLANPPRPDLSLFRDHNPRGFGLAQRDRAFDHYQDAAVSFERRPCAWVSPIGDWGPGQVALFELPTDGETHDNINVFWIPERPARAGARWGFDYRLSWTDRVPVPADLARVVATRTGAAGTPQTYAERATTDRKFVIDFNGGPAGAGPPGSDVVIDASASAGRISNPYLDLIGAQHPGWRLFVDWLGPAPAGDVPVVLRCTLTRAGRPLTETWTYSYYPQPLPHHR